MAIKHTRLSPVMMVNEGEVADVSEHAYLELIREVHKHLEREGSHYIHQQ